MRLDDAQTLIGSNWYRRPRKRPLVGPTGSPFLDATLVLQTRACRWFRKNKSVNPLKRVTFRDDAIISMSVAGEVTDTSIMEVGRSRPQFQYSREKLMVIKSLPLSKRRPDFLDACCNNTRGIWDPERWHSNRKRSDTPPKDERAVRSETITENHNKRRNGDPRERIRKEQDGIVLSPQRRSFNSGCFVNVNQPPNRRSESPIGKTEVSHRETVRRIGSGRILTRDIWDFRSENEKLEPERTDFSFRSGTSAGNTLRDRDNRESRETKERENVRDRERERDNLRDRDERNERFERRSFGRDFGDRERDRDRDRGIERIERNYQNDRDKERGRERRFSNDRRKSCSDNRDAEEPEWFSSGPTSQHDTIELRGFEDIPEEKVVSNSANIKNKKLTPAQKKRGKRNSLEKDEKQNENTSGPKGRSTPTTLDQSINAIPAPHSPISEQNEPPSDSQKEAQDTNESILTETSSETVENSSSHKNEETSHPDFNLDDFLKSDTFPGVPGLLTNGVSSNGGSCSRFSQWFKRESPVQQQTDSRRASIQDELLNNLLNDITEPNIQIPSVTESNTYFAPISPANPTTNNSTSTTGVKLLEMLQRGNKQQHNQNGQGDLTAPVIPLMKNSSIKDMEVGGKVVHSLEELEARMRGGVPPPTSSSELSRVNKTEEDLSAFKKLLAQVTGGQAVPAANGPIPQKPQSVTLMQLLNSQLKAPPQTVVPHQPVADQIHASTFNHVGPIAPTQHSHQAQMQHENLMKVLHIQQQQQKQRQQHSDMLSMIMSGQRLMGVSPVSSEMQIMTSNPATSGQELLQRPEAQAIIQGLQQGEITKQHLIQQLQNPAMQHRHREVLVNILKMYGGTTPRAISPHPSAPTPQDHILHQMLYQQQQRQPRIPSPMNNVIPHRVPSPRELAMHTQSIIQNALIKTKLEEQRENFHKRQDQQQQQGQQRPSTPVNSPAKQTMSPTPLAFTPTSVLRKMTADKEPEGANHFNHQVESIHSIPSLHYNNQDSLHQFQSQYISTLQLRQFSDNINKPLTCLLAQHENNSNNASFIVHTVGVKNKNNFEIEEAALKTEYLYSLMNSKDSNNNSNLNVVTENKLIVDNIKFSDKHTGLKVFDLNYNNDSKCISSSNLNRSYMSKLEIDAVLGTNNKAMETITLRDKECVKFSIRDATISKVYI